jgi:hypothetical protein
MSATKNGLLQASGPRDGDDSDSPAEEHVDRLSSSRANSAANPALQRSLADIKGQAQFLLYLADQIEDSLEQLQTEADACHSSFLCKVLGMYSGQLESKHQGLGEKIAEACQEVYVTVRERELV